MLVSYMRTILLYLVLLCCVRLMGKRQIGQMEASEFVVAMLVADLAAIPMQDVSIPLYSGLVPMLTVLSAELILSYLCLRSIRLRKLLCGKPVILIENGRILQQNLRRTRVTLDELSGHLREKDSLDMQTVQFRPEVNHSLIPVLDPQGHGIKLLLVSADKLHAVHDTLGKLSVGYD